MMAYYGEARTKGMSESGRLVWVHRRNGTWWPGQILSTDQVPESSMSSRRSGTPVKLLGRKDAIVEWFHVETSKRIKEFRCGEFSECIQKAEACSDHLAKRAVNCARRKDAILHALQLECAQRSGNKLEEEMTEFFSPSVSQIPNSKKQIPQNENIIPRDTFQDRRRTKGIEKPGVASKRKRTLTPHAKDFWKEKGILSEEPSVKRHHRGVHLTHGSGASQKLQVGCQGHQVEARSFCSEDFNYSGQSTSGFHLTHGSGASQKLHVACQGHQVEARSFCSEDFNYSGQSTSGLEPRNVDAESCPYSKSSSGKYDPASKLFEVDVRADRGYKSQNVPFICLESRFNGRSIFGHPLDVDILDDGFCDDLISGSANYIGSSDEDEDACKSHADRRSHGKHNKIEPCGSSRFTHPCPAPRKLSPAPKKLRRLSSLLASKHTSLP